MLAEQEFRHDIPNSTQAAAPLELPITVRGQVIGSLDVWPEAGTWTDEIPAMLEAIRDRLGQAIDSAQLFEEVQARASREQLLSQLTAHFTQSLDIDALLKGAVQELGLLPDVAEVSIQVGYPENGSPMKIAHREDAGTASGIDLIPEDR
jgi:GAF domain-containing protein